MTEDGGSYTAVKFAEFNRTAEGWVFKAVGDYLNGSIGEISHTLTKKGTLFMAIDFTTFTGNTQPTEVTPTQSRYLPQPWQK